MKKKLPTHHIVLAHMTGSMNPKYVAKKTVTSERHMSVRNGAFTTHQILLARLPCSMTKRLPGGLKLMFFFNLGVFELLDSPLAIGQIEQFLCLLVTHLRLFYRRLSVL